MSIKLPQLSKGRRSQRQAELYEHELEVFASELIKLDLDLPFKISARGWCYHLEGLKTITKDQFDQAQRLINLCRKEGLLPIDFVAHDGARDFDNVEDLSIEKEGIKKYVNKWLKHVRKLYNYKDDVAFWETQDYYIQMMVEKIDVKSLFSDICEKYHIPINNAKGWSDLHSRNKLAQRFKEAEEMGLKPVLLYYGDFDPAGILIADVLKKNIKDIEKATGWNPDDLIVERFGLTEEFIIENDLLWIDNLITGGKKDLSNPKHPDHNKPYVQEYIQKYGVRKCEANAILPISQIAQDQCEQTILKYLGNNCLDAYQDELEEQHRTMKEILKSIGYKERIAELIEDVSNLEIEGEE